MKRGTDTNEGKQKKMAVNTFNKWLSRRKVVLEDKRTRAGWVRWAFIEAYHSCCAKERGVLCLSQLLLTDTSRNA